MAIGATDRLDLGTLKRKVTIQRLATTDDVDRDGATRLGQLTASGALIETWLTIADRRWASIEPLHGTEFYAPAGHQLAETVAEVRMRYDPGVLVRERDRLLYQGRTFEVTSAIVVDEAKTQVRLLVREVK